ncbi:amidohydrolase family protein [Rhizorhabdus histidinilytica]
MSSASRAASPSRCGGIFEAYPWKDDRPGGRGGAVACRPAGGGGRLRRRLYRRAGDRSRKRARRGAQHCDRRRPDHRRHRRADRGAADDRRARADRGAGLHRPPFARDQPGDGGLPGAGRRHHTAGAGDRRLSGRPLVCEAPGARTAQLRHQRRPYPDSLFPAEGGGAEALAALDKPEAFFAGEEIDLPIPDAQYDRLAPLLEEGLRAGAIGIGSGTQYAPGITHKEMLDVTRVAGRMRTCVFTHVRYGSLIEPDSTLESVQESIANAAITGACVHVVHINSMAMSDAPLMTRLMREAKAHGADVSTEAYPWDGSVDSIRSVIFDPGWEKRWGVGVGDLQSRSTGKRLTQTEFDALRTGTGDDGVIMHMNSEATIATLLRDPLVLVASDGGNIAGPNSHPRSAGTFARVLGHYVRETGALGWSEAIRKMALMPAQRLEAFVPAMRRKGRLQAGADADIVLFDPATVGARAAYGDAARPSEGFRYVMVNGVLVVDRGALVPDVRPGRPVRSEFRK